MAELQKHIGKKYEKITFHFAGGVIELRDTSIQSIESFADDTLIEINLKGEVRIAITNISYVQQVVDNLMVIC